MEIVKTKLSTKIAREVFMQPLLFYCFGYFCSVEEGEYQLVFIDGNFVDCVCPEIFIKFNFPNTNSLNLKERNAIIKEQIFDLQEM